MSRIEKIEPKQQNDIGYWKHYDRPIMTILMRGWHDIIRYIYIERIDIDDRAYIKASLGY